MNIITGGKAAIVQVQGYVTQTIDDDENNVIEGGFALLRVENNETANIRMKLASGQELALTDVSADYINYSLNALVTKVYSTGTTFDTTKIKLYQ